MTSAPSSFERTSPTGSPPSPPWRPRSRGPDRSTSQFFPVSFRLEKRAESIWSITLVPICFSSSSCCQLLLFKYFCLKNGPIPASFCSFTFFSQSNSKYKIFSTISTEIVEMLCLGFEPRAAEWKGQMPAFTIQIFGLVKIGLFLNGSSTASFSLIFSMFGQQLFKQIN